MVRGVGLFLVIILSGCGVNVSSDPIKVDPIQVNHAVTFDPRLVRAYFQGVCELDPDNTTTQLVTECVDRNYTNFSNAFYFSTNIPGSSNGN